MKRLQLKLNLYGHLDVGTDVAHHRRRIVRKHAGHRWQVAHIPVDHAEERGDCSLGRGDRIKVTHISGGMLVPPAADAIGLVQKKSRLPKAASAILVDCHDDRLDVMVAPAFAGCPLTNFGERLDPRRMVILGVVPLQLGHH